MRSNGFRDLDVFEKTPIGILVPFPYLNYTLLFFAFFYRGECWTKCSWFEEISNGFRDLDLF